MDLKLAGKHILLTGASSGMGRQTAIELSKLGAKISLIARREDQLKDTIANTEGSGHRYYCFDLTIINDIECLIKRIILDQGPLDGFVHCAGIAVNRPISLFKYENVHSSMLLNFYSFYEIIRVVQRKKNFNPGLSIVGISSVAAQFGAAAQSVYAATKGAIDSASRCLAKELHTKNIRINTIAPAAVKTEMYDEYMKTKSEIQGKEEYKAPSRQYLGMGEPEDIAMAIVYLLSPISKFVTGSRLTIDGGYASSS